MTGGPGAGKSTSLNNIKEYLESIGYIVYIVPEAATELDNCGIDKTKLSTYDFQNIVLTYQLEMEALFEKFASLSTLDKEIIILYDRGLMDSKVYTKDYEEFEKLIKEYKLTEEDILDRYDLVLFLETAAKVGAYTTNNNKTRKEDVLGALKNDEKTFDVWKNHKNIIKIHANPNFESKKQDIINRIKENLNTIKRKQNKYLINLNKKILNDDTLVYITQYYLDVDDKYEYRLRRTTNKNITRYSYTVQKKEDSGLSKVLIDETIEESKFNELLNSKPIKQEINKVRKYLVINGIKCTIDIYEDGKCILESSEEPLDESVEIIEDVTNKKEYLNSNMKISRKKLNLII